MARSKRATQREIERILKKVKLDNHRELSRAIRLDRRSQKRVLLDRLETTERISQKPIRLVKVLRDPKGHIADWTKFGIDAVRNPAPEYSWVHRKRSTYAGKSDWYVYDVVGVYPGRTSNYWVFKVPDDYTDDVLADDVWPSDVEIPEGTTIVKRLRDHFQANRDGVLLVRAASNCQRYREQDEGRQFHRFRENSARAESTNRTMVETSEIKLDAATQVAFPRYAWRIIAQKPELADLTDLGGRSMAEYESSRRQIKRLEKKDKALGVKLKRLNPHGLERVDLWQELAIKVERPILHTDPQTVSVAAMQTRHYGDGGWYYWPHLRYSTTCTGIESKDFVLLGRATDKKVNGAHSEWVTISNPHNQGEVWSTSQLGAQARRDRRLNQNQGWKDSDTDRLNADAKLDIQGFRPSRDLNDGFRAICELKDAPETLAGLWRMCQILACIPKLRKAVPLFKWGTATIIEVASLYLLYMFGIAPTKDDASLWGTAYYEQHIKPHLLEDSWVKRVKSFLFNDSFETIQMKAEWPKFLGGACNIQTRWTSALAYEDPLKSDLSASASDPNGGQWSNKSVTAALPTCVDFHRNPDWKPAWSSQLEQVVAALNWACDGDQRLTSAVYQGRSCTMWARLLSQVDIKDLERSDSFIAKNHLLATAWQLTPWTFIIDWFVDIAKSLERIDKYAYAAPMAHYFGQFWTSFKTGTFEFMNVPMGLRALKVSMKVGDTYDTLPNVEYQTMGTNRSPVSIQGEEFVSELDDSDLRRNGLKQVDLQQVGIASASEAASRPHEFRVCGIPVYGRIGNSVIDLNGALSIANRATSPDEYHLSGKPKYGQSVIEPKLMLGFTTPIVLGHYVALRAWHYERLPLAYQTLGTLMPSIKTTLRPVQVALGLALSVGCAQSLARKFGAKPNGLLEVIRPASAGHGNTSKVARVWRTTEWNAETIWRKHGDFFDSSDKIKESKVEQVLQKFGDLRLWKR